MLDNSFPNSFSEFTANKETCGKPSPTTTYSITYIFETTFGNKSHISYHINVTEL